MDDGQVLSMPARRFWLMERNISRIQSANDLRTINATAAASSEKAYSEVTDRLREDLGEVSKVIPPKYVRREEGATNRMKQLSKGG